MRLEKIQRLFHFVEHRVHAAAAVGVDVGKVQRGVTDRADHFADPFNIGPGSI